MMPNRSKASRSNQLAELQTSVNEATVGTSSSGAKTLRRTRQLWVTDKRCEAAQKRGEKSMTQRLAGELAEAAEGRGGAMKKREEVHRMAEANKAFSHFRF